MSLRSLAPLLLLVPLLAVLAAGAEVPKKKSPSTKTPGWGKAKSSGVVVEDTRAWPRHLCPLEEKQRPQASAVAVGRRGGGAAGMAWGYRSAEKAREKALGRCQQMRKKAGLKAECRLYAVEGEVVFDFGQLASSPRPSDPESCLAHSEVAFYRLNAWMRVFRVADLSFETRVDAAFAVQLAPDGSLREMRWMGGRPSEEQPAREALQRAAPFGPLFGPLRCLAEWPIHFPMEDPRDVEVEKLEAPL